MPAETLEDAILALKQELGPTFSMRVHELAHRAALLQKRQMGQSSVVHLQNVAALEAYRHCLDLISKQGIGAIATIRAEVAEIVRVELPTERSIRGHGLPRTDAVHQDTPTGS